MKTKQQMIDDILDSIENWDSRDLVKFCQDIYSDNLEEMDEEELREQYTNVWGFDDET